MKYALDNNSGAANCARCSNPGGKIVSPDNNIEGAPPQNCAVDNNRA